MKKLIQTIIVTVGFNGLVFAASVPSTMWTIDAQQPSATNKIETNTTPQSGGIPLIEKNTNVRDGSITPSGASSTQRSLGTRSTGRDAQIKGTVDSVDQTTGRVFVKDTNGNVTEVNVTGQTQFDNNAGKTNFANIKPGDPVTLDLSGSGSNVDKFEVGLPLSTAEKEDR